jgi:hypothetical protein
VYRRPIPHISVQIPVPAVEPDRVPAVPPPLAGVAVPGTDVEPATVVPVITHFSSIPEGV